MSRVSYAMLHDGGAGEMTRAVREAIASLVTGLAARAGVDVEDILELTIVGNPIMHHLLLGIDPMPLGSAPFALATDRGGPRLGRRARAARAPGRAGLRAAVHRRPRRRGCGRRDPRRDALPRRTRSRSLVDVGTNAEIVLGDARSAARRLVARPARPSRARRSRAGQRAAPGAIERVRIDRGTLEPRFRVIGSSRWSDETGFAASTRRTGVTGICGSGIVEVIAELFLAGVITADGTIDGRLAERSPRIVPDGRTFSYVLNDGGPARPRRGEVGPPRRACSSPRTTSARSSSPRRRCTRARDC